MRRALTTALLAGATAWCLTILAAPLLDVPWVYAFFSLICHQEPERSWQLFGKSLPVCIRCASIYFAFAAALWAGIRANVRWLRIALGLMLCEFVMARVLIDSAFSSAARSPGHSVLGRTACSYRRAVIRSPRPAARRRPARRRSDRSRRPIAPDPAPGSVDCRTSATRDRRDAGGRTRTSAAGPARSVPLSDVILFYVSS